MAEKIVVGAGAYGQSVTFFGSLGWNFASEEAMLRYGQQVGAGVGASWQVGFDVGYGWPTPKLDIGVGVASLTYGPEKFPVSILYSPMSDETVDCH